MKKLILQTTALLLCATLAQASVMPIHIAAAPPEPGKGGVGPGPRPQNTLIVGCIFLAMGGIIVYGLVKACQKIPKMDEPPPPPPMTNSGPAINWTNRFGTNWHGAYPPPNWRPVRPGQNSLGAPQFASITTVQYAPMPIDPVAFDVSKWGSTNYSGRPVWTSKGVFNQAWHFEVESSTDLEHWLTKFQCYLFEAETNGVVMGTLLNVYRPGYPEPVYEAYFDMQVDQGDGFGPANYLPVFDDVTGGNVINLTEALLPAEFFRIKQ